MLLVSKKLFGSPHISWAMIHEAYGIGVGVYCFKNLGQSKKTQHFKTWFSVVSACQRPNF